MKKLFYIALIVVVLMVIAKLVKKDNVETAPVAETIAVEEAIPANVAENEAIANTEGAEAAEEIVAEEVIEENPEETADEDETIVKE